MVRGGAQENGSEGARSTTSTERFGQVGELLVDANHVSEDIGVG